MAASATDITVPQQREIDFYDDRIVAVLIPTEGEEEAPSIFVPIRPICEQLGLAWSGQYERIQRDPVLSEAIRGIRITRTPQEGGTQELSCLPIEYLNGWLFGISANRVKPTLRGKIIRYQRECYQVLWSAFRADLLQGLSRPSPAIEQDLTTIRVGVYGILEYLWQRQRHDDVVRRLLETTRLDVHEVGGQVEEGDFLTERQRLTIYHAALELVALLGQLGEMTGQPQTPFPRVFGGLKKTFGVETYRLLPRKKYRAAYDYLAYWRADVQHQIRAAGEEPCVL